MAIYFFSLDDPYISIEIQINKNVIHCGSLDSEVCPVTMIELEGIAKSIMNSFPY